MNVFIVALYAVNIFFILLTLDAIWYMIVNIIRHKLKEGKYEAGKERE